MSNTTGSENTANGAFALFSNVTGIRNNALGSNALYFHTTGNANNAVGAFALNNDIEGQFNNAFGDSTLASNTIGNGNTGIGDNALLFSTTGDFNTAGAQALGNNTGGSNNVGVGFNAGNGVTTADNVICIRTNVLGANVDNSCFIGNIFGATTVNVGTPVLVDSAGQLGTISSSRGFKHEIKPMDEASEAILALKPVTFRYRSDRNGAPQFGLIAEDVAKVNPDLVVRDENGEIYSVRYDQVNAMLLNEFLKQHKRVEGLNSKLAEHEAVIARQRQEFQTTVARQDKEIRALIATVKEQASQIQKVSAQAEMRKSGSQMLVENQ